MRRELRAQLGITSLARIYVYHNLPGC